MGTKTIERWVNNVKVADIVVQTSPRNVRPDEFLELLPAAVVKAVRDATAAGIVAKYEALKIKPYLTPAEGTATIAALVSASLMTQAQADAIVWPEA